MSIEFDLFLNSLKKFAVKHSQIRLRENGYSHLLFSELSREYGDTFMAGVGIFKADLSPTGPKNQALVDKHLRKSKDLYPDLVVFKRPLGELGLDECNRLNKLNGEAVPLLLCEWKFTSAFPSMQRAHVVKDAIKLQVLTTFLRETTGQSPRAVQVIFHFPPPATVSGPSEVRIRNWFKDQALQQKIPDVGCYLIDHADRAVPLTPAAGCLHIK